MLVSHKGNLPGEQDISYPRFAAFYTWMTDRPLVRRQDPLRLEIVGQAQGIVLPLPGAFSAFRLPALSFWPTYLIQYLLFLVAEGSLEEEPGWRGFALPRLEPRSGPLVGTLLLGVLWGLWHLPLFFIPFTDFYGVSFGTDFVGHLIGSVPFVIWTIALAVFFTWVFNNTRGSLLLAMLLHASINTAPGALLLKLFPSPPLAALFFLSLVLVWVVVALIVITATRGRLSYLRYQRETALPLGLSRLPLVLAF